MPFKSQAQRAKFYSDPKLRKYVPEFEAATPKDAKLPERIGPVKLTRQQRREQRLKDSIHKARKKHG